MWRLLLSSLLILQACAEVPFAPDVQATCKAGFMIINVRFPGLQYKGVVHSTGHRAAPCAVEGDGSNSVTLSLPLITDDEDADYCGVRLNATSKEKFLPLAVRSHSFLELAEDKFYTIKCGLHGFRNSKNESSFVELALRDSEGRSTSEAVFNRQYLLRAQVAGPDTEHAMRMRNCFSFGEVNTSVQLTGADGCPVAPQMQAFTYNDSLGLAEAGLTMFRFADTNRVNFQCEVQICKKPCPAADCDGPRSQRLQAAGSPDNSLQDGLQDNQRLKAATTVWVVDPSASEDLRECSWYPPWLWILCIALAVLFLIMMLINVFLCSAMTCSCTKTSVIEREPSVIEEYDPYRSEWHGSQCGSRRSSTDYVSGGSTLRSDHYAVPSSKRHGNQFHNQLYHG